MNKLISFLAIWVLLVCGSAIHGISPSLGVAQGEALAGVASSNLLFMKKNAANISAMPTFLFGGFSHGARIQGQDSEYDTPFGGLLGLRYGPFTFAAHGSTSTGRSNVNLFSMGGGIAYSALPNLSIGVYSDYHQVNGERYLDANLGMIYSVTFFHEFIWGVGIYEFAFALSALSNPVNLSTLSAQYQTVPGVSFQFFRTKYVNLHSYTSLALDEGFGEFNLSTTVTMQLFKYVKISGGTSGNDIFNFTNYYAGSSINATYKDVSMTIYGAYEQNKFKRYLDYDRAEFSGGFYIDYAPPLIRLKQEDNEVVAFIKPEKVFSPNGDGKDDFMTVYLTHTKLTHVRDYSFAVLDQNRQVVTIKRADLSKLGQKDLFPFPNEFIWNGLNYRDQRVAEGLYSFRLVAVLPDGTKKVWRLGEIRLDKEKPTFNLYVRNKNYLLGSEDQFRFSIRDEREDTEYYEVKVLTRRNHVIYQRKLLGSESEFIWDGSIRKYNFVDSGTYSFQVAAVDEAGNKRYRTIEDVQFYEEETKISLNMKYDVFSPNGDGRRDTLPIQLLADDLDNVSEWQIRIISADQRKEVNSFSGEIILPNKVVWRGLNEKGEKVPDGVYHMVFSINGKDGSYRNSLSYRVFLDSSPPQVTIKSDNSFFTPDADGLDDSYDILIDVKNQTEIIAYKIKIRNEKNDIIFENAARDVLPPRFSWDGVLTSGFSVDSFEKYSIEIEVMDAAGNLGRSNRLAFETGLIIRRMSSKLSSGQKDLLIRFPNIAFARRTAELDKPSTQRVRRLAKYLVDKTQYNIEVIAHTDSRGSTRYNRELSEQRANHVRDVLIRAGLTQDRVKAVGKGESELLYVEVDDAARTRNRRFEIKLKLRRDMQRESSLDALQKEIEESSGAETDIEK